MQASAHGFTVTDEHTVSREQCTQFPVFFWWCALTVSSSERMVSRWRSSMRERERTKREEIASTYLLRPVTCGGGRGERREESEEEEEERGEEEREGG
eukprot:3193183-Rhodomonas_salina.2